MEHKKGFNPRSGGLMECKKKKGNNFPLIGSRGWGQELCSASIRGPLSWE